MQIVPIPYHAVREIRIDDEWNKAYVIQTGSGVDVLPDDEVLHFYYHSNDGIRGVPLTRYAAESLGLHKQVLDTATSFYENAARPSVVVKTGGKLTPEALEQVRKETHERYCGPHRTGEPMILQGGADLTPIASTTADDARIIDAMSSSVADIARWWNLDALMLGDKTAATYANLGAAHTAFYCKSIRPLLDCLESEINYKCFGVGGDLFAEFKTDGILRGDPVQQSQVDQTYSQMGVLLRSEIRASLNLPPVEGLDQPLYPLNQGPSLAQSTTAPLTPTEEGTDDDAHSAAEQFNAA